MRDLALVCLLVGTMAWPTASAVEEQDRNENGSISAPNVAQEAPVLTIRGLCPHPTLQLTGSANCQTVITRAQFEKLVDAIQPEMDAQTRRHLARAYPQYLEMAHEAEQRRLDQQPRFGERLAFARLQILSQELIREIQEEAARVPAKDIADYYQKNSAEFELYNFERIVVPLRRRANTQANGQSTEPGMQVVDDMSKEAEALRVRAAAGEDFAKLQKEAYEVAGMSGNSEPNPSLSKTRRRGLPPAHASMLDLKPGQVSPVISDVTGHYIYKLDSKEIEPLDSAKQEITNALRQQRVQQMIQSVEEPFTTEVNSAYFGADRKEDHD